MISDLSNLLILILILKCTLWRQVGNVYAQFREEEHAANAVQNLTGRFYAGKAEFVSSGQLISCHRRLITFCNTGRPIIVDFSPVTDFREATCRQYEENTCNRGGYCNFMHLKKIGRYHTQLLFFPFSIVKGVFASWKMKSFLLFHTSRLDGLEGKLHSYGASSFFSFILFC